MAKSRRAGDRIQLSTARAVPRAQERVLRNLLGLSIGDSFDVNESPSRPVYPPGVAGIIDRPQVDRRRNSLRRFIAPRSRVRIPSAKPSFVDLRTLSQLGFARPARVAACLSRRKRREILFAARIAGRRGIGRGKRWRRTQESQYSC